MNIIILADIQDVLQSPHPVFGIPLGIGLFILILFKLFASNKTPPSNPPSDDFSWRYKNDWREKLEKNEDWKLPKRIRNQNKSKQSSEHDFYDIANPKPDHDITEKLSVKEQLLADLRKSAEMGMLSKKEYGIKRQKILDIPENKNYEKNTNRKMD